MQFGCSREGMVRFFGGTRKNVARSLATSRDHVHDASAQRRPRAARFKNRPRAPRRQASKHAAPALPERLFNGRAWINDDWVLIPREKIVLDHAPNGEAYLFMLAGTIQCFVRPKGGL